MITTITTNLQHLSEFGRRDLPLNSIEKQDAYNLGNISAFLPAGQLQYRESKRNPSTANWHTEPDPYGRLIIYISGKYKITVGKKEHPESRIFCAGDVLFFNDQTGVGHITEVLEEGAALTYKLLEKWIF
jgi:hypothetical protein